MIMKRSLFLLAVISFSTFCLQTINGQVNPDAVTAEEKKAVGEIADRFEMRLDQTGTVETVATEMFVTDFVSRWRQEQRNSLVDTPTLDRVLYVPGMEFDPSLLEKANEDDWRSLYFATFDFFQLTMTAGLNKMVAEFRKGKGEADLADEIKPNDLVPKSVTRLFDKDPILKNLVVKKDGAPLKTPEDMGRVTKILRDGIELIRKDANSSRFRLSPDGKKVLQGLTLSGDEKFGPWLNVSDGADYGYPKGTRLITFFSSPWHQITITKVTTGGYSIVNARVGWID